MNKHGYTLLQFIAFVGLLAFWAIVLHMAYGRNQANTSVLATEHFLQQVRMEQEARCEFGRNYAVYANELSVFSKPKDSHTRYDLSSGVGITAFNDQYDYALSMPSYADGRVCCDDCEELRIKYPPCEVLKKTYDYLDVKNDCSILISRNEKTTAVAANQAQEDRKISEEKNEPSAQEQETMQDFSQITSPADVDVTEKQEEEPSSIAQESLPSAQPESVEQEPVQTSDVPTSEEDKCSSGEKGLFYSEPCSTYRTAAQGTVLFSWDSAACKYEIVQNCSMPALWEKMPLETHAYPDVYPTDVEKFCQEILENNGCDPDVVRQIQKGKKIECPLAEETTCYSGCRVLEQTPVQETAQIILYNLSVGLDKLYCRPARKIQVSIP